MFHALAHTSHHPYYRLLLLFLFDDSKQKQQSLRKITTKGKSDVNLLMESKFLVRCGTNKRPNK
jgi:ABC-type dipeptide/oligopeptide/nickel transport system ATPase component